MNTDGSTPISTRPAHHNGPHRTGRNTGGVRSGFNGRSGRRSGELGAGLIRVGLLVAAGLAAELPSARAADPLAAPAPAPPLDPAQRKFEEKRRRDELRAQDRQRSHEMNLSIIENGVDLLKSLFGRKAQPAPKGEEAGPKASQGGGGGNGAPGTGAPAIVPAVQVPVALPYVYAAPYAMPGAYPVPAAPYPYGVPMAPAQPVPAATYPPATAYPPATIYPPTTVYPPAAPSYPYPYPAAGYPAANPAYPGAVGYGQPPLPVPYPAGAYPQPMAPPQPSPGVYPAPYPQGQPPQAPYPYPQSTAPAPMPSSGTVEAVLLQSVRDSSGGSQQAFTLASPAASPAQQALQSHHGLVPDPSCSAQSLHIKLQNGASFCAAPTATYGPGRYYSGPQGLVRMP